MARPGLIAVRKMLADGLSSRNAMAETFLLPRICNHFGSAEGNCAVDLGYNHNHIGEGNLLGPLRTIGKYLHKIFSFRTGHRSFPLVEQN